jgi:hypothetical protein
MRQHPGKYADIVDEWLHQTAIKEDDGFGDVEAPTGYVFKLDVDPDAEGHESAWLERKIAEWYGPFFLVIEDSQGTMLFPYYATAEERDQAAQELSVIYDAWAYADDDGGCEGHESLAGAHMGESIYCDGSCR